MKSADEPPHGYNEPATAWCVEYVDPREPEAGPHQLGAFTSQGEAERLLRQLQAEGVTTPLHINIIPIHRTVEDWQWDR